MKNAVLSCVLTVTWMTKHCYAMTQYTHINNVGEDVFCVVGAVVISRV
jgi:hypothetical protein